jgi:hypothetical protein
MDLEPAVDRLPRQFLKVDHLTPQGATADDTSFGRLQRAGMQYLISREEREGREVLAGLAGRAKPH